MRLPPRIKSFFSAILYVILFTMSVGLIMFFLFMAAAALY